MRSLLILIFLVGNMQAVQANSTCEFKAFTYQNVRIQTGKFRSGVCYISLSDSNPSALTFRSHLLTDEGLHLIFNSFGYAPSATHTGAREFVYLTGRKSLDLTLQQDQVNVTLGNRTQLNFDAVKFKLLNSSDIVFNVDEVIKPSNEGGVSVIRANTAYLDFGFRMGGSPRGILNNDFIFHKNYQLCVFKNGKILKKVADELEWKINPINEIEKKLEQECI